MKSYEKFTHIGLALDPIHVGTGGTRIGRVDLTIVRDPVTGVPKIPGSSLAGVYRTYVAMAEHEKNPKRQAHGQDWPYYPHCAGLGQPRGDYKGHCGQPDCPVCTVFGFARGRDSAGGFAGLAAFTDAHVLLFPVPTRQGPRWVTCPDALRLICPKVPGVTEDAVYLENQQDKPLNLGWLLLPVKTCAQFEDVRKKLCDFKVPGEILSRLALVPDRLFAHIVNSNLEVRTSVSINPETGAAEEGKLFSYEALPRGTVLVWETIAKNPQHFRIGGRGIAAKIDHQDINDPDKVWQVTKKAHPYLEHLGIGGMGTRGMGRLKVVHSAEASQNTPPAPRSGEPSGEQETPATEKQEG